MEETKKWLKEGNEWFEKGDFSKAIECYDKAIELNPNYAVAHHDKGYSLCSLGEYQQAIEYFDKAIELNPNYALAYVNKGYALSNLGEYQQAIECYNKAIELNPNYTLAYASKGYALSNLGEYQQAIECYNKAIELNPNYTLAYANKGYELNCLGKYQEAIGCFDKAINLNPSYTLAYVNKGYALSNLGEYQQAIECYNKAIELDPNYALAYANKGYELDCLGKYQQAIEFFDKAIGLDPNYALAYNNKGYALSSLGEYQQAIECYNKAIELDPNYGKAHINKKILSRALLLKDNDLLKVLRDIYPIYNGDFYDDATLGLPENDKHCNIIYFLSLKILNELCIKKTDKHETNVAHYTSKKVSQVLLFDREKEKDENGKEKITDRPVLFRLSSVTNSNDTQEGKTLFNYLFDNQKIRPQSEHFVAFVGCFMFNFDNLNQFRLYGKEEGTKEGTGVSIVMNSTFFSLQGKSPIQQRGTQKFQDDTKEPLFRCIYIDPETNQVISIGHRDFHTFYKVKEILYSGKTKEKIEKKTKEIESDIETYKTYIEAKTKNVKKYLNELKDAVDEARKKGIQDNVICNLLLNLRYLVKHVAFKEEQECRIVKIKKHIKSDDNPPKNENNERFFLNYLPLKKCVERVYFGPKATGMELFQNLLTFEEGFEGVICYRSTSPLA